MRASGCLQSECVYLLEINFAAAPAASIQIVQRPAAIAAGSLFAHVTRANGCRFRSAEAVVADNNNNNNNLMDLGAIEIVAASSQVTYVYLLAAAASLY